MDNIINMFLMNTFHTIEEKIYKFANKKVVNGYLPYIEEVYAKKYEDLLFQKYYELGILLLEKKN